MAFPSTLSTSMKGSPVPSCRPTLCPRLPAASRPHKSKGQRPLRLGKIGGTIWGSLVALAHITSGGGASPHLFWAPSGPLSSLRGSWHLQILVRTRRVGDPLLARVRLDCAQRIIQGWKPGGSPKPLCGLPALLEGALRTHGWELSWQSCALATVSELGLG